MVPYPVPLASRPYGMDEGLDCGGGHHDGVTPVTVTEEGDLMPELIQELEYHADLIGMDEVGGGPFGQRMIANVSGGQFVGDRLKGSIVGAGADWLLVGQDGFCRLDVRATFKTVDGALIYVQYYGVAEMTPAVMDILAGGVDSTNYGDQYFFTNPRMETGDERYSWVNQTMFIGEGRLVPGPAVEYRVYRVANS